MPLQQGNVVLLQLQGVGEADAVLRQAESIAAGADDAVGHGAGEGMRPVQLQRHALAGGEDMGGLRRLAVSQMGEGGQSVEQRDEAQGEDLAGALLAAGLFVQPGREGAALQRRQQTVKEYDQRRGQNRENGSQFHVILSVQR